MVPKQASLIILNSKSAVFLAKNGKDTKYTIHISMRINFVRNGEECNMQKTVWCEVDLKLAHIGTKNVREDESNTRLGYTMVIIYNWQNTCSRGVIGYRIV